MALLTNRYNDQMPKAEVYNEIYSHLSGMALNDLVAPISSVRLDLHNDNILIDDVVYSLSPRAEGMLADRLQLGNMHKILSNEVYSKVEAELQEHLAAQGGELKFKHRAGLIHAIVSDRYNEIPYDESVRVLEEIGARPIRLSTNDAILKVQAIFDAKEFDCVDPVDGETVSMGVQMQSSDVGASSLQFDVFTYRWICGNGMIMGKNSIFKFRKIHIMDRTATATAVDSEVKRVLKMAKVEIEARTNKLIKMKVDRTAIVQFLARQPFGKKALAMLAEKVITANTMYDVVNVLTAEGHNPVHSASLQASFETAAGELMMLAA